MQRNQSAHTTWYNTIQYKLINTPQGGFSVLII